MNDDLVSILIVSNPGSPDALPLFSREDGFAALSCSSDQRMTEILAEKKVDILLIDACCRPLEKIALLLAQVAGSGSAARKPGAVFLSVPGLPDPQTRSVLYRKGCSQFFVPPFSADEVKSCYDIYRRHADLEMQKNHLSEKIARSRHYLETFKSDLKTVKSELYEERTSLNNALKQINRMTQERSRLKKRVRQLTDDLLQNTEGFFGILADLVKHQVERNRGHGERVARIAQFVGRHFKMDEKQLDDLAKAAMLHEVGLLFIPAPTREKPEHRLDAFEKDLLLQYPMKGADLLDQCSILGKPALIIRSLNENSDGTGYPNGLKRRYIPLGSRILAGADLFDTLTDDDTIDAPDAFLKALESFSGTRLDPAVVAVLQEYAVLHMKTDSYRVRGLGIHQLEPGMVLGTAIFSSTGTKLFSVNTLLTQDAIDKIKKYNKAYPVNETVYIKA